MRSIYSLLFLLITLGLSSCSEKKPTLREQSFDEEWLFYRGDIVEGERSDLDDSQWRQVNLPHDWSIEDIPGTNSPLLQMLSPRFREVLLWVELAGIENISMWMQLRKGDVLLSLSMEFI